MNRCFTKEDIHEANNHMKKCSLSLVIREMQIKTVRYRLTPVRVATTKKSQNSRCCQGCREKATLTYCWWEYLISSATLWKAVWRFLKQQIIELPFIQQSHFWIYTQRKTNHSTKLTPAILSLLQHNSQQQRHGINPGAHQQ